jgi:transposase
MQARFHLQLEQLKEGAANGGSGVVTSRALAEAALISHTTPLKVIADNAAGTIRGPKKRSKPGMGSKSLSLEDELFLLTLYCLQPSTSLARFKKSLFDMKGTKVSRMTISRWFNTRFPFKGKKVKTCNVPLDKFKPANILRWKEYILEIEGFAPHRLKFGDEKHIKGADLYGKVRIDPITGDTPSNKTDGDFRNTYTVVGICGVDHRVQPVEYTINNYTNDSTAFNEFIDNAIVKGFLLPGDVLVLDNAAIHTKGESSNLFEFLWDNFQILVICLPMRAPELNPIELLWNTLNGRLPYHQYLGGGGQPSKDAVAIAASEILDAITHAEVAKYYQHCGYIPKDGQFGM